MVEEHAPYNGFAAGGAPPAPGATIPATQPAPCASTACAPRLASHWRAGCGADVINDHDMALFYVLEHYGEHLPSFAALPPEQQRAVAFTQAKMGFNHGWLVQVVCLARGPRTRA